MTNARCLSRAQRPTTISRRVTSTCAASTESLLWRWTRSISSKSGKTMTLIAGEDFALSGKKKGIIELTDELTIKVGSASITLKKNGDIVLNGKKISVTGSGDVVLKGTKVTAN